MKIFQGFCLSRCQQLKMSSTNRWSVIKYGYVAMRGMSVYLFFLFLLFQVWNSGNLKIVLIFRLQPKHYASIATLLITNFVILGYFC